MFFKKKKRGLIDGLEAEGGGLLNRGVSYKGVREVIILEETETRYKVEFVDSLFQRSDVVPKWYEKEQVELINE